MIQEWVACNICGNKSPAYLFEIQRYKMSFEVKKCNECGLVYLSPRPTHNELCDYYSQVYGYDGFLKNIDSVKQRCQGDLSLIQRYKDKGNLLEVGCMYGFLLDEARKQGYNSYGIEISQKAVDYANKNLGLDICNGRLEDCSFDDQFFDIVFLSHLIEHLEDPSASLKIIHRIIRDDGVLIIRCPNFGSLMSKLTGRHWWWIAPPEHLYHFTPKTINAILNKVGFSQVQIHTQRGDLGYLRYLVLFFVALLPIPQSFKAKYKAAVDNNPNSFLQRALVGIYSLAKPLVSLIHEANMGEEMVVVARK